MPRCVPAFLAVLSTLIACAAAAEDAPRSECLAMAAAPPRATPVSLHTADAKADEVAITYAGHSTYYIDTPRGRADRDRLQRRLYHRPTARCRHHEPRARHALHFVPGSAHSPCTARLGR